MRLQINNLVELALKKFLVPSIETINLRIDLDFFLYKVDKHKIINYQK